MERLDGCVPTGKRWGAPRQGIADDAPSPPLGIGRDQPVSQEGEDVSHAPVLSAFAPIATGAEGAQELLELCNMLQVLPVGKMRWQAAQPGSRSLACSLAPLR